MPAVVSMLIDSDVALFVLVALAVIGGGVWARQHPDTVERLVRPMTFGEDGAQWAAKVAPYVWIGGGVIWLAVIGIALWRQG